MGMILSLFGCGEEKKGWRNKIFKSGLLISLMLEEYMFFRINLFKLENIDF